ncbi:MAG TPA: NFACT RNA binding domain-containing protein [Candidatus Nanoarchaeia archaeon]|nr:NFACT RNA binding domain-containing protein [Candidatus Nanoarchaeia archaeon]
MQLELDTKKSVEQNAAVYYDRAKKIKKKIEGAKTALAQSRLKLAELEKKEIKEIKKKEAPRAKEWYEKFRWFYTSEGLLVIGGRDATTNEIVVKKHTDKDDLVFHTDMIGSPFFVIKNTGSIGEASIKEAADATVTFSRAWKLEMQSSSVFYCRPDQLTKEAPSGEFVPKGGFITKGKLTYAENKVNLAICLFEGKVMAGPLSSVKSHCKTFVEIEQGRDKASSVAKYIEKKIGGSPDEIIRVLPSGGFKVKKV